MKKQINRIITTIKPDIDFTERSRLDLERMVRMASSTGKEPINGGLAGRWGLALGSIILLFLMLPTGLVWADEAKPGDVLYPIDQLIERIQEQLIPESEYDGWKARQIEERATEFDAVADNDAASVQVQETAAVNLLSVEDEKRPNTRYTEILQRRLDRLTLLAQRSNNPRIQERLNRLIARLNSKQNAQTDGMLEVPPKPTLKPLATPTAKPIVSPSSSNVTTGDANAESSSETHVNEIDIKIPGLPFQLWQERIEDRKEKRRNRRSNQGSSSSSESSIEVDGSSKVRIEVGD